MAKRAVRMDAPAVHLNPKPARGTDVGKSSMQEEPVNPLRSRPMEETNPLPASEQRMVDQTIDSQSPLSALSDATTDFGSDPSSRSSSSPSGTSHPSQSSLNPITASFREATANQIGGYKLAEKLGEGGMGRVYKALDSNARPVAIKLLSPKWAASPDALLRFKQEGFIASQINHPHCVFVHRVDEEQGIPYIAMELMSGRTLKDIVAERGALPYREAIELILQCIEGLIETHSKGMIHRDIKPANCYLDEQGNVKIGDFGLARSLVDDSELTRTGAFLGTPLFASPKQVLGQPIDERSDIYSLSATLYYLLAGKAPFESPNAAQVIAKIASADPPPFRESDVDVPKGVESIVMKGLARDRSKRYESFAQMRNALLPIVAPKEEVASIRRRVLAMLIDSVVISTLAAIVLLTLWGPPTLQENHPILNSLAGTVISFLYLFLFEGLFSSTLGKNWFGYESTTPTMEGSLAFGTSPYVSVATSSVPMRAKCSSSQSWEKGIFGWRLWWLGPAPLSVMPSCSFPGGSTPHDA